MQAVVLEKIGAPNEAFTIKEQPLPDLKDKEILIKIKYTSVNVIDTRIRGGVIPKFIIKLPQVIGGDVAGTVEKSFEGSNFKIGDRVFAMTEGFKPNVTWGTYAQYAAVPENQLALIPQDKDFAAAASVPLVALTAYQSLEALNLQPGQHVLIHAGAGGVGIFAIQLAKARGLKVSTTASTKNIEFLKSIGADYVIDYTKERFEDVIERPVDAVIDGVGGDYESRSIALLQPRTGTFITMFAKMSIWKLLKGSLMSSLRLGPRYVIMAAHPNGEQLTKIAALWNEGKIKPVIHKEYLLKDVGEAHTEQESGHCRGKIVLKVDGGL